MSPLLDGFTVGNPVNDHFGVCCYPAVKANSERKYIVKVISIPASQTQLDALLITGAYKDTAQAAEYFRTLADNTVQEAEFLKEMSHLEGFIPYDGCQVEPMQKNRIGYDIFLLSGFRLSLERYIHRHEITKADAIAMGTSLCASLSACRRAGKMYIDLKPANIFISTKKECKIGDLGFVSLEGLKFASMPEKYRSCYTAPELQDDLNGMNTTADTYSLGVILYQLFNNGILPEIGSQSMEPPANADEKLAEIILKACAAKPEDRWEDPAQLGQALAEYQEQDTEEDSVILSPNTESLPGHAAYETTRFPVSAEEAPAEAEQKADDTASEPVSEEPEPVAEAETTEEAPEAAEALTEAEADETAQAEPEAEETPAEEPVQEPTDVIADMEAAAAAEFAAIADEEALRKQNSEENMNEEQLDRELNNLNQMLRTEPKKKKDKKKHPNLKPVVVSDRKKKSPVKTLLIILLFCILLAGSVWGYIYYQSEYLKNVKSISIAGTQDGMTVTVKSEAKDSLLTVVCTDPYGNAQRQQVRNGTASFSKLTPGSMYKVSLEITGLHKLTGQVSEIFTTEAVTTIAGFIAAPGPEDCSVQLTLTVDGHEPDQWKILYSASGEAELSSTFSGHSATIGNLVLGKEYTFRLIDENGNPVDGQSTTKFTSVRLVRPDNLQIVSCRDGVVTVQWSSARAEEAAGWTVHCTGPGYDETLDTQEMIASFTGIDQFKSYTIEVNAKGMTQTARTALTANPITVTNFTAAESGSQDISVSWEFEGAAPEGGWLLQYTLDGSSIPSVVKCADASASFGPRIPGSTYHFTVQASSKVSVFNDVHTYKCPAAAEYNGHGLFNASFSAQTLLTPENDEWIASSLHSNDFTTKFPLGQSISLVLICNGNFYLDEGNVHVLYVFRDEYGNALTELTAEDEINWASLWIRGDYHYGELTLPVTPGKAGNYILDIFFDGLFVTSTAIDVY